MRRTAVLLLGLAGLTGCDQVFGLGLGADGPRDGGPDGGAAGCIPTAFTEPFDDVAVGTDVCLPWGYAGGTGAAPTREGGALVIRPPARQVADGACSNGPLVAFEPGGVFVEHERVLALASTYTTLTVRWAAGARELAINIGPEQLVVATTTTDPTSMEVRTVRLAEVLFDVALARWWRIRPVADGLVAETSGDGQQWRTLAQLTEPPPATVQIGLNAGTFEPTDAPGEARFAGLNVCPP